MNRIVRLLQTQCLVACALIFLIFSGMPSTYAQESKPLSGADLKQMLAKEVYTAGWANRGYPFMDAYAPDGGFRSLEFDLGNGPEIQRTGTWQIEGDELCLNTQAKNIGMNLPPTSLKYRCFRWRNQGEKFEYWRTDGGAEGYFYILGD